MGSGTTDTLARQWETLRLIPRSPRRTTVQALRKELQHRGYATTARTIERDLHALSSRFGLVVDESSKPYGWSWARDANFEFAPRLSVSQGVALLLSQMHLRRLLPQSLQTELAPVFELAEREVAATGWKDWHRRTAVLSGTFPQLAPSMDAGVLDAVHSALALKRCLSGRYHAKGGPSSKDLRIHPLGLLVRGQIQYVVCTLRDYQDVRHLALHRLTKATVLEEPCVPPSGFDFDSYVASCASRYQSQGPIRMVANFTAEAAEHLKDAPVSKDQVIVDLEEAGWVELSATVDNDQTLRWWLLGFGARAHVVEPPELREEMHRELQSALRRYG